MNNLQQGILKQKLQSIKSGWFRNYLLIAMLLLLVSKTQAQFPVQVTPIVLPPYTQQLSEYYSGTNPKIAVTLTNADLNKPLIDVTLRMTISSQNILLKSKNNVIYPTISLSAGVPYTLSQADLAVYFNPDNLEFSGITKSEYQNHGIIPSGFYTFCFEVIENITALPASNKQCTYAAISRNLPPFLNLPLNNSSIESADPNNIVFTWTPRHLSSPNSLFTTQYKFQLVEFLDNGVSPDVAFRTGQPLYQTIIPTTSFLYGPIQPLLISGKKYGWRVQVINTQGSDTLDMYDNDGYSEVYSFTYMDVCHAPSGVTENITPDAHVHVSWNESRIINTNGYILQYKKKNEIKWITLKNNVPEFDLDNLYNGETYEYRCGNNCKANEDTLYDNIHTVNIPNRVFSKNSIHGRVSWVYKETEEVEDTSTAPFVSKTGLALDTEGEDKAYYLKMKAVYDRQGIDIASVFAGKPVTLNLVDKGGKDLHFLKWATVTISNDAGVVAVCKTDVNGYFETVLDEQLLRNLLKSTKPFKIKVTHPSKLFNFSERLVTSRPTSQITTTVVNGVPVSNQVYNLSTGWDFGEDTLVAQSFELKQMAVIKNYTGAKVTADVLLRQSFFDNYPFMLSAGLGVNSEVITYDHADYVKLVTIDNGKAYKKLFLNPEPSEYYLVRINYPGRPPVYYPLNAVTQPVKANGHRELCIVNKRYPYKLNQGIEGIITAKNIDGQWLPQEGARVEIRIDKNDILGKGDTVTSFMAISDKFGNYGSYDIPPLKEDASIQVIVTANSIRSKPFIFTTTLSGELNTTFDIKLVNFVYTATGRLLNQFQKPIENASITVLDSDGIPSFTTKDGFYLLKFYDYDTAKIKIQFDGQEDEVRTITPSNSWNFRNGNQPISASDWSNAIHRTKQVVANPSIFNKLNGNDAQVFLTSKVYADRAFENIFNQYFSQLELPRGVVDLDSIILQQKEYDYNLIVNYKDKNGELHEKISAGLEIINSKDGEKVFEGKTNEGEIFNTKLVAGNYTILLKGLTDNPALVPYKNDFEISASELGTDDFRTDTINMSEGVILTGKVTSYKYFDTANNWKVKRSITEEITVNGKTTTVPKPVDSALIALSDLELSVYTDKDGKYKFIVPIANDLAFSVSKDEYNSLDTVFNCSENKAVDFQLELRDSSLPSIYTIAGFPVIIDKLYKAENLVAADKDKNIFTVSGKMKLVKNDIFDPGDESKNNTLTFTNAVVEVEEISDKNAIPTRDIVFNEVILNATAFGFVPVEITGVSSVKGDTNHNAIRLKGLEDSWENSVIVGSKAMARFSTIRKVASYLPFALDDAELTSVAAEEEKKEEEPAEAGGNKGEDDEEEAPEFVYVYATPEYKINALSEGKEFGLKFLDSLLTNADADSGSSSINTAVTATTTAAANAVPLSSKCKVSGGTWTAGVNGAAGTCACTLPKVLQADGSCAIPKTNQNTTPITEESKCTTSGGTWTAGATPSCNCPTGKVLTDGICITTKDSSKIEPKDSINFRLGVLFSMRFAQDNIKLSKDGLQMESGVFRLIKPLAIKLNRNIQVERFVINKDLNVEELKIDVSKGKPLGIRMGRVKTNITSFSIIGIGGNPTNYGGGLGGSIELFPKSTTDAATKCKNSGGTWTEGVDGVAGSCKCPPGLLSVNGFCSNPNKPVPPPAPAEDTTFISLEVKKVPDGISFKGEVKLDESGLSLGNLIFKTPNSTNGLSFAYDAEKKIIRNKSIGYYRLWDKRKSQRGLSNKCTNCSTTWS
jgi:TANFOR domain-containing protein